METAYYLVHSLGTGSDFEATEAEAAGNFGAAAKTAGVKRVIYVGGLCDEKRLDLSTHLRSRCRVGEVLREQGVRTVEFRASVIIGSGSLSFELIRSLVQRLPMMVTPKWVSVQAQPIATSDPHWTERRHAVRALGDVGRVEDVPTLVKALKDEHVNVRVSAAHTLSAIGDASALPALNKALADTEVTKINAPTTVAKEAQRAIGTIRARER